MTTLPKIKKIAAKNDVKVRVLMTEDCEGKKIREIHLSGFLDDLQAVSRQVEGYDVTQPACKMRDLFVDVNKMVRSPPTLSLAGYFDILHATSDVYF